VVYIQMCFPLLSTFAVRSVSCVLWALMLCTLVAWVILTVFAPVILSTGGIVKSVSVPSSLLTAVAASASVPSFRWSPFMAFNSLQYCCLYPSHRTRLKSQVQRTVQAVSRMLELTSTTIQYQARKRGSFNTDSGT